jgi:hypothetical protein
MSIIGIVIIPGKNNEILHFLDLNFKLTNLQCGKCQEDNQKSQKNEDNATKKSHVACKDALIEFN